MSCVLRISGKMFDVSKFLEDTSLKPYKTFKKGELIESVRKHKHRYEDNGCYFDASKAEFDNLNKQIRTPLDF